MVRLARFIGLVFIWHYGRFQVGDNATFIHLEAAIVNLCLYNVLFMCSLVVKFQWNQATKSCLPYVRGSRGDAWIIH